VLNHETTGHVPNMKIHVLTTLAEIDDNFAVNRRSTSGENGPVVVIDVLRSSSSILNAFSNGCKEIIPVESVERALSLKSALFESDLVLCGERDGKKINGFELGNSPYEYTREKIGNKSLIFTSTNGSVALIKLKKCNAVHICGFQNITEVGNLICTAENGTETEYGSIDISCSGHKKNFALEDVICAGMLIDKVISRLSRDCDLSDSARSAYQLYEHNADSLNTLLKEVDHGRELMDLGMEKDLDFCIQIDTIPLLPVYSDGKIKRAE